MGNLATFGAGCFWGVQALFDKTPGVISTRVGYSGGHTQYPSYQEVCTGETGHVEVIQIEFDSEKVSYEDLLEIFFANHNPTTLNQQGPDHGTQYRSVIFYHNPTQETLANAMILHLTKEMRFKQPIVTTVEPFMHFYPAEEYHQKYLAKQGKTQCDL